MIQSRTLRSLLAIALAAFAGISLSLSVLPIALQYLGVGDQLFLGQLMSQYALITALIWAMGGWAVSRVAFPLGGAVILAVVGLASGVVLVALALEPQGKLLLWGGLSGLIYGFLGGLILGRILMVPSGVDPER